MRLIKELYDLYDRNLIDMDEYLHYYDLMRQHDINIMSHNKVVPVWWVNNIFWDIKRMMRNNIKDEVIVKYVIDKFDELSCRGKYKDGLQHAKKNWGEPPKRYK